jgi:hypothetical protein
MLNVFMLNVIMLNVVMLNVMAPTTTRMEPPAYFALNDGS